MGSAVLPLMLSPALLGSSAPAFQDVRIKKPNFFKGEKKRKKAVPFCRTQGCPANTEVPPTAAEVQKAANEEKKTVNKGAAGSGIKEGVECLVDHLKNDLQVPEAGEKETLFTDMLDDNPMEDAKK